MAFGWTLALCLIHASPALREERVELVGVSEREGVAVVNVGVRAPRGNGVVDQYEVSRLIALETGETVATFRRGHGCSHPEWQSAAREVELAPILRRLHKRLRRVDAAGGAVSLGADPDARLRIDADEERFTVTSAPGSPMGFYAMARLFDGRYVPITHLRVPAVPGRVVRAELSALHTPSGQTVLVKARFTTDEGGRSKQHEILRIARLTESPLGTTRIGVMRAMAATQQDVARLYGTLHPGAESIFRSLATW